MSSDSTIPSPLSMLTSPGYVEDLYVAWENDPRTVPEEWQVFFAGFDFASDSPVRQEEDASQAKVGSLIFAYRSIGHLIAQVDPLGTSPTTHPELEISTFGLQPADLDKVFDTGHLHIGQRSTLREIIDMLQQTYCRSVGVEYIHIQERSVRRWLQEQMEPVRNQPEISNQARIEILRQLIDAEIFETFIHSRYQGQKRFSLEGAESLIPALHAFMHSATDCGVQEVVMGMAHRGRLNVLANILHKPYAMIFHEFADNIQPDRVGGGGDVKYHRGYTSDYSTEDGRDLHISLTANPSHLEAVGPVVEGRTRAKQRRRNDMDRRKLVVPLLIHGDAAFAGQGLVAETLNLSQLKGYRTGGTVHLIINNQIGFTTSPGDARSTRYPTDVAKLVDAPIFHVNGDDPEAVCYVTDLALRFRQEFACDVVVDMICYRKHGHNEGDEPAFTQPLMYQKIRHRPSARTLYQLQLEGDLVLGLDESNRLTEDSKQRLYEAFKSVQQSCPIASDTSHAFSGLWKELDQPYQFQPVKTGVTHRVLEEVARALTTVPEDFNINRKIQRRLPQQLAAVRDHGSVDWGLAELLAFGSLLVESVPVRLSGQDSIRGTFSHRHAAWFDMKSGEPYFPLHHIRDGQARFCAYNSMLSEAAVLGFDYGYALVEPRMLVLWEAQFGDFANGAQVIIDQFIAAAMDKWERACGLVMLLPHGYEGQGPEHSSAYLERYLILCAENNIQVCNLTTPAQYFHVLRRQLHRDFRRPLVIMSPKSLLRHKLAVSPVDDLVNGSFGEFLPDPQPPRETRRLLLCSGKVYYDLLAAREEQQVDDAAIVRVEQFYPFNEELFKAVVAPHLGAQDVVWVQEETANRGGCQFTMPRLQQLLPDHTIRYAGREASASPATGSMRVHRAEQEELLRDALGSERRGSSRTAQLKETVGKP